MRIRTLDLFAGVGGSSAGARKAGARIVAAVDAWPLATETYRENFPDARVLTRMLDKVPIQAFHESIGNIDLILASPECTNHTLAKGIGKRCEASRECQGLWRSTGQAPSIRNLRPGDFSAENCCRGKR